MIFPDFQSSQCKNVFLLAYVQAGNTNKIKLHVSTQELGQSNLNLILKFP